MVLLMPEYLVLDKQIYNFENFSLLPIRDTDKFKIMKWRNEQLYHLRQKEKLTKKIKLIILKIQFQNYLIILNHPKYCFRF